MGFVKKTWVDRAVQFANRRVHTPVPGMENTFDVTRAEGTVFTVGDKPNAAALNDLETRVDNAIKEILTLYHTESAVETKVGDNLYTYTIISGSAIPVGAWTTLATFPPAIYKNLRIDFGLSYMLSNDVQMLALDSANGTTGMVRLVTATGEVQAYSASVANLKPVVKLVYNK